MSEDENNIDHDIRCPECGGSFLIFVDDFGNEITINHESSTI